MHNMDNMGNILNSMVAVNRAIHGQLRKTEALTITLIKNLPLTDSYTEDIVKNMIVEAVLKICTLKSEALKNYEAIRILSKDAS